MTTLMIITCPTPQRAPTLDRLHATGVDLFVLYLHRGGANHGWGEVALNHPHHIAESPADAVAVVVRFFRAQRVDLLASFGYRESGNAAGLLLARLTGTPVVVRSDSNLDGLVNDPIWKQITRRLLIRTLIPRRATAWSIGTKNELYWASEGGLSRFDRIPYEVPRLPGGAPAIDRDSSNHDCLQILYVGRLSAEKRVGDILRAASGLDELRVSWMLTLVGRGPDEDALRLQAGHDPRVRFIGPVPYDALATYYSEADVLVLPSENEPWGLTVNEALGFGLWTICSSAVGAAQDLLTRDSGAIYQVGDVQALTQQLLRSLDHPKQIGRPVQTDTAALMAESIERHRRTSLPD